MKHNSSFIYEHLQLRSQYSNTFSAVVKTINRFLSQIDDIIEEMLHFPEANIIRHGWLDTYYAVTPLNYRRVKLFRDFVSLHGAKHGILEGTFPGQNKSIRVAM